MKQGISLIAVGHASSQMLAITFSLENYVPHQL